MRTRPARKIPRFKSDEEAAELWHTHDFADYIDDTEPVEGVTFALPRLKQISLRLAPVQIERLKRIAASKGLGYQTRLRMWITERARQEKLATHGVAGCCAGPTPGLIRPLRRRPIYAS